MDEEIFVWNFAISKRIKFQYLFENKSLVTEIEHEHPTWDTTIPSQIAKKQ